MFYSDFIISCITPSPSVANTLKYIYLCRPLWYEFTYEYYNDNNDTSGLLFQQYRAIDVENFFHPSIVNECKSNMDKAYYEDNHNVRVYIPSEKSELDLNINVDCWP